MENAALGLIRGPPCLSLLSVRLSSSQTFGSDEGGGGVGDGGDGVDGEGLGTVIDANSYKGPEN